MKDNSIVVRIVDDAERDREIKKKKDELLDVYSLYLKTGSKWVKEEAILKAYELHMLDTDFTFEI